jgi:hypothetical protein
MGTHLLQRLQPVLAHPPVSTRSDEMKSDRIMRSNWIRSGRMASD